MDEQTNRENLREDSRGVVLGPLTKATDLFCWNPSLGCGDFLDRRAFHCEDLDWQQ